MTRNNEEPEVNKKVKLETPKPNFTDLAQLPKRIIASMIGAKRNTKVITEDNFQAFFNLISTGLKVREKNPKFSDPLRNLTTFSNLESTPVKRLASPLDEGGYDGLILQIKSPTAFLELLQNNSSEDFVKFQRWFESVELSFEDKAIKTPDDLTQLENIIKCFKESKVLLNLDNNEELRESHINIENLVSIISKNNNLIGLSIINCDLDVNDIKSVLSAVNKPQIKSLDISGNPKLLGVDIAKFLSENKSIEQLDLARCDLTDPQIKPIFDALLKNPKITSLDLSSNEFGAASTKTLADFLSRSDCKLKNLAIQYDSAVIENIDLIIEALKTNTSLEFVDLSGPNASDTQFPGLGNAINNLLHGVDESQNDISESEGFIIDANKFSSLIEVLKDKKCNIKEFICDNPDQQTQINKAIKDRTANIPSVSPQNFQVQQVDFQNTIQQSST